MADLTTPPNAVSSSPASTADRAPVSAFVITFNEEEDIAACLDSLAFCDEVVVIDSHSTDGTAGIAEAKGARVIARDWPGYRDQKAFGLEQVEHEWVLNIDADERVTPKLRADILRVLREEKGLDGPGQRPVGYGVNRIVFHLGRWWRRGGWYPEWRLRFFRRSYVEWGGVDPHEKPIPKGPVGRLDGDLEHYSYADLDDQFARLNRFSTLAAKELHSLGKRFALANIIFSPIGRVFKFYVLKRGFREGLPGLMCALAEGHYAFLKYAKLWELENRASGRIKRRPDDA